MQCTSELPSLVSNIHYNYVQTRNLAITKRSHSASYNSPSHQNTATEIIAHISKKYVTSFFHKVARAPFHIPVLRPAPTGRRNAQPQGWYKCSVARHHQACLTVCEV